MSSAFDDAFAEGCGRALIVGTDCPEMNERTARRAFELLNAHYVVLGPAADGGYYLIGMKRPQPVLFAGVDWGTSRVLETTLRVAERLGLTVAQLATSIVPKTFISLSARFDQAMAPQPPKSSR